MALRSGQFQVAQTLILKQGVPKYRSTLASWAQLARRAHLWRLSLLWLHPIVRPKMKGLHEPASDLEKCEYSIALQKAGALNEAGQLSGSVDSNREPRALMAQAYVQMAKWDYRSAEKLWTLFLESSELKDYERAVGLVNQVACLVANHSPESRRATDALVVELMDSPNRLLTTNALELQSQSRIQQGAYDEADELLDAAASFLDKEKAVLDSLFIQKWKAINAALRSNSTLPLEDIRARALALRHWETLRDLDFYRASIEPASRWKDWIYFGSPFPSFRDRLERKFVFADEVILCRSSAPTTVVDVWFSDHQDGSTAHRTFAFLLRDFYRPSRTAEIFSALFPAEHYSPESSPTRVHKIIERTRAWVNEQSIACRIEQLDGEYALRFDDSVGFRVRKRNLSYSVSGFMFLRRRQELPVEFDSTDWSQIAGVTRPVARKQLKTAVDDGILMKSKDGRNSLFRFGVE